MSYPFRLTLEPEPAANSDRPMSRIHVYESSVDDADGKPLVSLATRGPGMRLSMMQAAELRDWLAEWLA
jgi:hypothetical protein